MLVKHHLGWWRTLFRVLLCFYSCSYYSSHAVFCFAAVEFDPAVPFLVDLSSTKQLNMYKFRCSHESLTKIQMFLFLDIFRQFYSVWWHELTLNLIIILTQTCPKLFPEWSLSLFLFLTDTGSFTVTSHNTHVTHCTESLPLTSPQQSETTSASESSSRRPDLSRQKTTSLNQNSRLVVRRTTEEQQRASVSQRGCLSSGQDRGDDEKGVKNNSNL